jgi:hypothetical protein
MAEREAIRVRLVVLGQGVRVVACPSSAAIDEVLAAAGVDATGKDVRVNGRPATESQVTDGDLVTVIPRVRGGRHARRSPIERR